MSHTEHGHDREILNRDQGKNKAELIVFLPVGTGVQGCGLQTRPSPAAQAPSSPRVELYRWLHCPTAQTHTEEMINH